MPRYLELPHFNTRIDLDQKLPEYDENERWEPVPLGGLWKVLAVAAIAGAAMYGMYSRSNQTQTTRVPKPSIRTTSAITELPKEYNPDLLNSLPSITQPCIVEHSRLRTLEFYVDRSSPQGQLLQTNYMDLPSAYCGDSNKI